MFRGLLRAAATALLGALLAGIAVAVAYASRPDLVLEMDRPIPPALETGWHAPERDGDYTFAWTSPSATLMLRGLLRDTTWECRVRFRGARGVGLQQPQVNVAIDGITVASAIATNDQQELVAVAPPRPLAKGLTLTVAADPAVVPGGSDTRALGVQVDRVVCQPSAGEIPLPPRQAMFRAALAGSIFGVALALSGITFGSAILGVLLIAAAQALPLAAGPAPYTDLGRSAVVVAAWIGVAIVAAVLAIERALGRALRNTARFAILFSGVSLYLQLLGLLHPSKLVIDAVFHAHRLDWVLAGRYFFTQPMPGGISFPYAIGLYVFAAPWSLITNDHVTLLRVVVTAVQVIAGGLLYPVLARGWGDRITAAIAVALFSLVPLPYELLGNANLANVFAQAVALAAVLAAVGWPLQRKQYWQAAGLLLVTALAFLSHVSTFAQLTLTLIALAALFAWKGGPALRAPARWVTLVTIAAALFSVAIYYGRFTDVYVKALRVRAAASAPATTSQEPATIAPSTPTPRAAAPRPFSERLIGALSLTRSALGWPILILGIAGACYLVRAGAGDRVTFAVLAWGITYAAFLAVALMRVDAPFQRYAAEFVGRVVLATYPAAVMLAARAAGSSWRAASAPRIVATALMLWAVKVGVANWAGWFS